MEVKEVPIPLFGSIISNRSGSSTDDVGLRQEFVNVIFEKTVNAQTGQGALKCLSRPGWTACTASGDISTANAQGIYFWPQTQSVYAAINNTVYKKDCSGGFTSASTLATTGSTLNGTASLLVWFDEFYDGTNYYLLIKNQNGALDRFSTTDVVTNISTGNYTGLTAQGPTVNAWGFVFAMGADGKLANSDINNPTAWTATNYLYGSYPDKGVGVARTDQYVIGLREYSTEFYVNGGNQSGSILSRVGSLTRPIGCTAAATIVRHDEDIYFVGRTRESGYGVYRIRGGQIEPISTETVNRYLFMASESCTAAIIPMEGHVFYIINLFLTGNAAPYNLVFDITENQWLLWQTARPQSTPTSGPLPGGTFYAYVRPTSLQEIIVALAPQDFFGHADASKTNFAFYKPVTGASQVYTDGGSSWPITYRLQTDELTFNTPKLKINHYVRLSGTKGTGTITINTCDDGTGTFLPNGTIDMSTKAMAHYRLGMFNRRQYQLTWQSSFQALEKMYCGITEASI